MPKRQEPFSLPLSRRPAARPAAAGIQRQFFRIPIEPMGKPRQTRSDKWRKRDCVLRYRSFADQIRAACAGAMPAPVYVGWTCYYTMPASWSQKKRAAHTGKLHQAKPDRDNTDKGILDALIEADQCVAVGSLVKRWDDGNGARIELVLGDYDYAECAAFGAVEYLKAFATVPADGAKGGKW